MHDRVSDNDRCLGTQHETLICADPNVGDRVSKSDLHRCILSNILYSILPQRRSHKTSPASIWKVVGFITAKAGHAHAMVNGILCTVERGMIGQLPHRAAPTVHEN